MARQYPPRRSLNIGGLALVSGSGGYAEASQGDLSLAASRHVARRRRADIVGLHVADHADAPPRDRRLAPRTSPRAPELPSALESRRGPGLPTRFGPPLSPLLPHSNSE